MEKAVKGKMNKYVRQIVAEYLSDVAEEEQDEEEQTEDVAGTSEAERKTAKLQKLLKRRGREATRGESSSEAGKISSVQGSSIAVLAAGTVMLLLAVGLMVQTRRMIRANNIPGRADLQWAAEAGTVPGKALHIQ
ncbi:hypothetical protein Bbelb_306130 [Branchiostoma belcheri]|nr:hypothetical protein Bbelb_306130 [Branchiostoma belcheri]